jgi:hypothetical protein
MVHHLITKKVNVAGANELSILILLNVSTSFDNVDYFFFPDTVFMT